MANSVGRQAERNRNSLVDKKQAEKVDAREVVQCSNDNCFLGLDVDITLVGSTDGCYIAKDVPNKTTNKNNKTLCI